MAKEVKDIDVNDAQQITEWTEDAIKAKVAALKKEHGIKDVFVIQAEDKIGFVKRPSRNQLAYAMTLAQNNPLAVTEEVLKSGWLDGDTQLMDEDKYFLGISSEIDALIETTDVAIKKY